MGHQIILLSVIGTFDPEHINKLVQTSQNNGLEILHASTHYDSKLRCAIGTPEDLSAAIKILQEGTRDVVIQSDAAQPAVSLSDILAAVNAGRKELKALLTPDKKKKGAAAAANDHSGGSQEKTTSQTSEETGSETKTEMKENHPDGDGEANPKTLSETDRSSTEQTIPT